VVPRKFTAGSVPALPVSDQLLMAYGTESSLTRGRGGSAPTCVSSHTCARDNSAGPSGPSWTVKTPALTATPLTVFVQNGVPPLSASYSLNVRSTGPGTGTPDESVSLPWYVIAVGTDCAKARSVTGSAAKRTPRTKALTEFIFILLSAIHER